MWRLLGACLLVLAILILVAVVAPSPVWGLVLVGGPIVSGEDQRHSYHEEELEDMVDSRYTLPDGRIVEESIHSPEGNPPNVIGGNNADL